MEAMACRSDVTGAAGAMMGEVSAGAELAPAVAGTTGRSAPAGGAIASEALKILGLGRPGEGFAGRLSGAKGFCVAMIGLAMIGLMTELRGLGSVIRWSAIR